MFMMFSYSTCSSVNVSVYQDWLSVVLSRLKSWDKRASETHSTFCSVGPLLPVVLSSKYIKSLFYIVQKFRNWGWKILHPLPLMSRELWIGIMSWGGLIRQTSEGIRRPLVISPLWLQVREEWNIDPNILKM